MTTQGHRPPPLRRPLAIALATVIGVLPTTAAHAQEPAPTQQQPSTANSDVVGISVVLMVAVADDARAEFKAEFRERQFPKFAREHGLLDVGPDGDAELVLRLQIVQPDKSADIYMISSTALYHGEVYTEQSRACLQCSPAETISDALGNVARAAALVVEHRAELEPPPADAPAPASSELDASPITPERERILGPASKAGISISALGLGAAITGAVLLDRGKIVESEPGAHLLEWIDYRPPGAALMGVGVGAMVVGSVLIGVDLGVLRPRRRERSRAHVDGISAMTARPGVVVTGRF